MKIDLVIPYVDNNEPIWQKSYISYCLKHNFKRVADMRSNRYEDIGLINYQLKLVEKNMPWVNNIYLILSNKEQKPKYLPSNCKIVLHTDIIPFRYLPTFNSTTIEMFLWNIHGLEEYFIYANDDMLPLKPLQESDFYYKGMIRMNFNKDVLSKESNIFRHQCYNSYKSLLDRFNLEYEGEYIYPEHTFTPMIKSHCKECFELIKDKILPHISAFRTERQHNQYIYPLYELIQYSTCPSKINFYYSQLDEINFEEQIKESQILCANIITNKDNGKILLKELQRLCE